MDSQSATAALASELNNLLQVISGTSSKLERACADRPDTAEHFATLSTCVARASEVAGQLLAPCGSPTAKIIMHPELSRRPRVPVASTGRSDVAQQKRIMVVDDEKMLLILTRDVLSEAGYSVVTADSGFKCLELFRAAPFSYDLILLDLSMPLMDGEETFRRLQALRPDVRVMLCTGFVQQERLNHMLAAGLTGFIQKPLGPREYVGRVRAALARATFGGAQTGSNGLSLV